MTHYPEKTETDEILSTYNTLASDLEHRIDWGADASKPSSPNEGDRYIALDTNKLYLCYSAGSWTEFTGDGATTLLELTDTPADYTGAAKKIVVVNEAGDAIAFASNLYWDETNDRVGIGTNAPDSIFHIKANVPGTVGSHPAGQLIIQDPNDTVYGNAVITGYESDGAGNPDQQLWYLGSSSGSNSDIILLNRRNSKLQLGTNGAAKMTISGDGKIGIGLIPTANMMGLSIEEGLLTLKEIATPTADTNYGKIYTKSDNKLYFQDGAGVEHKLKVDAPVIILTFFIPTADITVGANKTYEIYAPCDLTIDKVYIHAKVAPGSGKTVTPDVNKNGTTIFTTQGGRPTITAAGKADESDTPDVTSVTKNDIMSVDIDVATADHETEDMVVQIRAIQA